MIGAFTKDDEVYLQFAWGVNNLNGYNKTIENIKVIFILFKPTKIYWSVIQQDPQCASMHESAGKASSCMSNSKISILFLDQLVDIVMPLATNRICIKFHSIDNPNY
ncbi:hypothetical protein ACJIZ3_011937 [Penstemon smallii]|uniref:Uncharacterized protein n=1 Tax=Penstemon smallii TaxID=265156 RepID=A0ABD3UKX9_9LAMI